jgi:hypothetical protein
MGEAFDLVLGPVYRLRRMRAMVGVLAALVVAVPLTGDAQETTGDEVKPQRDDAARKDDQTALGDTDLAGAAALPNPEKQARAEKMLAAMRDALRRVTELKGEAKNSKDIAKLNCVNEKLTQIKGLLRIAEDASVLMYDAIAANTQDVINHNYTKILVAHQKAQMLRVEAEQCVGEVSFYTGDTEVIVDIDEDIPQRDPTVPEPPPPSPEVPVEASPF